ncbi:Conserved protein [Lacticaseibacillus rhamnosus GG]|nr:Conserved protein [Lacticaseibacillus rhamnosus GG]
MTPEAAYTPTSNRAGSRSAITRSPAQKSACKDLSRNGQRPAITPEATYTPTSIRAGSRSAKKRRCHRDSALFLSLTLDLVHDFICEVFLFLFNAFADFITNVAFNLAAFSRNVLGNCLIRILNEFLINQ